MYDALTVARYVINKCFEEGKPVTNLRLQKLLYFIQLESYKKNNMPLFGDDLYAWQFGPVVPDVYYEYNMYGGSPILLRYSDVSVGVLDSFLIDNVINKKKCTPIWKLVDETHEDGGPWEKTWSSCGGRGVISKELVQLEAQKERKYAR